MEGAIIFASLVVGVAITDQLVSLHRLLRVRRLVRWDPLALIVAFIVQLAIIMVWWGVAQPSEESVTIGQFLPVFLVLVLTFLLASASLPDSADEAGRDLKRYYDEQGGYIWTLFTLASVLINAIDLAPRIVGGEDWDVILYTRRIEWLTLALMASLIFVRKRWYHWPVIAFLSLGPIGWLSRSLG